jgi:hypothetical protein
MGSGPTYGLATSSLQYAAMMPGRVRGSYRKRDFKGLFLVISRNAPDQMAAGCLRYPAPGPLLSERMRDRLSAQRDNPIAFIVLCPDHKLARARGRTSRWKAKVGAYSSQGARQC